MSIVLQGSSVTIGKIREERDFAFVAYDDRLTNREIDQNRIEIECKEMGSRFRSLDTKRWVNRQERRYSESDEREKDAFEKPRFRLLFDYLRGLSDKNARFLDLGCRDAGVAKKILDMGFTDVTAVDLPDVIEAIHQVDGIRYMSLDLNSTFVDGCYDIIYAGEVIEHLYNDFFFLLNCYKHTADGGLLVVTAPQDPPVKRWYEEGMHLRCYPDHTLAGLVACVGFRVIQFHVQLNLTRHGPRTVAIVFAKKGNS